MHRSGRTARAAADGIAIALVTPGDARRYDALLKALDQQQPPEFPVVTCYHYWFRLKALTASQRRPLAQVSMSYVAVANASLHCNGYDAGSHADRQGRTAYRHTTLFGSNTGVLAAFGDTGSCRLAVSLAAPSGAPSCRGWTGRRVKLLGSSLPPKLDSPS